jgi:hypothetical protein
MLAEETPVIGQRCRERRIEDVQFFFGSLSIDSRDQPVFFFTISGEVYARNSETRNVSSSEKSP